jgi:hypothetical protein
MAPSTNGTMATLEVIQNEVKDSIVNTPDTIYISIPIHNNTRRISLCIIIQYELAICKGIGCSQTNFAQNVVYTVIAQ